MERSFDAVVVGAGPAGSLAALKLARAGLKVAVLERGDYPGSKNIFGGLLHNTPVLNELLPDFEHEAPLERHVYRKTLALMTPESSTRLEFESEAFERQPFNGYTVMRPSFDGWLAQQAVKAGATLLCKCSVDELVWQGERVVGVKVKGRDGELRARIVIAADGVLSFLALKAGLRQPFAPRNLGLGIKLLLGLPRETINERFGLARDQGADYSLLGAIGAVRGGGFLYTNSESLSFGLVVHLESLKASGQTPYDLLNRAMAQPYLAKLLKGGVPLEYSAHLIPEGGLKALPRLFTHGMLLAGDAAGLCYANGINLEGINLAMTSGVLAAETALEAHQANDFSAQKLSAYQKKLGESFVLKDMKTFAGAVDMLHIDRLYQTYPGVIGAILERIYRVDGAPRQKILKLARQEAMARLKMGQIVADGLKIRRAIL